MVARACTGTRPDGTACRSTPQRDSAYCFWHDPVKEEEAAEARRLGGLRRRREKAVAGAYALESLTTTDAIRRLLDIATLDVLGLENSIARARVIVAIAMAAAKLLETGELETRLAALEAAHGTGDPPGHREAA